MHLAIGKILNKEQKAKDQIKDLENQLQQDGQDIKQKIGKNKTFTVMEIQPKQVIFLVDNRCTSTEIFTENG